MSTLTKYSSEEEGERQVRRPKRVRRTWKPGPRAVASRKKRTPVFPLHLFAVKFLQAKVWTSFVLFVRSQPSLLQHLFSVLLKLGVQCTLCTTCCGSAAVAAQRSVLRLRNCAGKKGQFCVRSEQVHITSRRSLARFSSFCSPLPKRVTIVFVCLFVSPRVLPHFEDQQTRFVCPRLSSVRPRALS